MIKGVKQPATLLELAKELNYKKSKLQYYAYLGLIKPKEVVGKTMLFERMETMKTLGWIKKEQLKGFKLREIQKKAKGK